MNVYLVTHVPSSRHYVGKAVNVHKRWINHRYHARNGTGSYLHAAMAKYGEQEFTVQVLEVFDSDADAFEGEEFWVQFLRSNVKGYGFNLDSGGAGGKSGIPKSPSHKRKLSEIRKGIVFSEEHRARLGAASRARWKLKKEQQIGSIGRHAR